MNQNTVEIFISDELREILTKIQNQSEIAKSLLRKSHEVDDIVVDYVNYISVSNDDKTKLSYLTKERQSQVSDFWDSNRRFMVKPGAFVRKVFKNYSDKDIEKFATLFRNHQSKLMFDFKIVGGSRILKYYSHESYLKEKSSLGASCMKHDECQDWFDLYVTNTSTISMLVLVDRQDRLVGRSLLWETGDYKIMDRIYTVDDENFSFFFKRWADENGYLYKREQKWNNTMSFESDGSRKDLNIGIKLDYVNFDHYPYLDTFKFLCLDNQTIYNYIPKDVNVITISSADGKSRNSSFLVLDIKTNLFYNYDVTVYIDYLGGRVFMEDACYSQTYQKYIHSDDAMYVESIEDYVLAKDYSKFEDEYC
jgi:hypothetical protein